MSDTYAAITIHIRAKDEATDAYAVEAELDDGARYQGGQLRIDRQALLRKEHEGDIADYGLTLFDALFHGPIRRAYDKVLGATEREFDGRVRVRLWIDPAAAELQAVPWERMYHIYKGQEVPLATSAGMPTSRYISLEIAESKPVSDRPLRVLFALSNPEDLPEALYPVEVEQELDNLLRMVGALPSGEMVFTILPGRTGLSPALKNRLQASGFEVEDGRTDLETLVRLLAGQHVLHFVGHGHFRRDGDTGEGTTYLFLEGEDRPEPVEDDVLTAKLANLNPTPHLVFLSACESAKRGPGDTHPFVGLGPKLVGGGIPAVVAMQEQVPMMLSRKLNGDFYRRLLEHGVVDRALNEARNVLWSQASWNWSIPVLFMRLRDGQLWEVATGDSSRKIETKRFEPETVLIPAGPFLMGSQPGEGVSDHETPQHTIDLPNFRIGRSPVTNSQYERFLRKYKSHDVPKDAGWFNRKPPKDRLDHPVVGVSWGDAVAYCQWLSRADVTGRRYRLPSEAEWEKAASWDPDDEKKRAFPWDDKWVEGVCNVAGTDTSAVTAHLAGASAYGVQDLLGNVQEWTRSLWGSGTQAPDFGYQYDPDDGREVDVDEDLPPQMRVVHRGGSYKSRADQVSNTQRSHAAPASRIGWRGFRVAMEV